jgi:hypothetical protein
MFGDPVKNYFWIFLPAREFSARMFGDTSKPTNKAAIFLELKYRHGCRKHE